MNLSSFTHRVTAISLAALASFLLTGCDLSVETSVNSSGKVQQTITIAVPEDDFTVTQKAAEKYLRDMSENWRVTTRKEREIVAMRKFHAAHPGDRDLLENVRFTRDRRPFMGWLIPVDRIAYEQAINANEIINSEQKRALAEQVEAKCFLTLPGRIDRDSAAGASKVQGGTAMWKARADQGIVIKARSTAFRWWWFVMELILLGLLVWALMPVIAWFSDASGRYGEKRKTARVDKMRKREQIAAAKAEKRAARNAAAKARDVERQKKADAAAIKRAEKEEARRLREEQAQKKKTAQEAKQRAKQEQKQKSANADPAGTAENADTK
ncbi:MAG: hypothetical protein AUJ92_09520 [Armatimonadetes bacterium CG2_30_59_28]|nr:MAG: hypothetical protein AUJ92_09520 [Armatimonadetes bacterium CG2_30_59_28]PIU61804.1 MAG: hypothetical protein COS85_20250 [Armatimonadetes bacterium CG07_land_8_20_14_0_80_59_28]PIY44325.1 MAG: hypothetical protein COZ05_08465 [Armatimonadetes bacterium CG_4_10_14_3_um_filter_59_10]